MAAIVACILCGANAQASSTAKRELAEESCLTLVRSEFTAEMEAMDAIYAKNKDTDSGLILNKNMAAKMI